VETLFSESYKRMKEYLPDKKYEFEPGRKALE